VQVHNPNPECFAAICSAMIVLKSQPACTQPSSSASVGHLQPLEIFERQEQLKEFPERKEPKERKEL